MFPPERRLMMAEPLFIPPNGVLKLYSKVDIGNGKQRIFKTKAAQNTYFSAHFSLQFDEMSYMRLNRAIRVDATVAGVMTANYLSFVNKTSGVEGEIYCAIEKKEYVNNNTVEITFSPDWWQTCMFDMTVTAGVVEREHLSVEDWKNAEKNPWANIPQLMTKEDLEMDESMEKLVDFENGNVLVFPHRDSDSIGPLDTTMALVMIIGNSDLINIEGEGRTLLSYLYGPWKSHGGFAYGPGVSLDNPSGADTKLQGVPSISYVIGMPYDDRAQITDWNWVLNAIAANDMSGNIMGLYYVPKFYTDSVYDGLTSQNLPTDGLTIGLPIDTSNYAPRNPKLKRYPFNFIRVFSNAGQFKEYKYEYFMNRVNSAVNTAYFRALFTLNGEPSIRLCPYLYRYSTSRDTDSWLYKLNFEEAISYTDIPHIPYATDGYVTYLANRARQVYAQNANPMSVLDSAAKTAFTGKMLGSSTLGGALTAAQPFLNAARTGAARDALSGGSALNRPEQNPIAAAVQGFLLGVPPNMKNHMPKDNIVRGSENGFIGYMKDPLRFTIQRVTPRDDILEVYDTWFDYFGYFSHQIKIPYVCNYVKNSSAEENIPHFAHVGSDNVTYCKAHITVDVGNKAPDIAARYIAEMFDAGTLFVTNETQPADENKQEVVNE